MAFGDWTHCFIKYMKMHTYKAYSLNNFRKLPQIDKLSRQQQHDIDCRTVRGPSMSCDPGKVQILGATTVPTDKGLQQVLALRFLQGRNPDWVGRPFFAAYNEDALWLDDLKPAFGQDKFFYEEEFAVL